MMFAVLARLAPAALAFSLAFGQQYEVTFAGRLVNTGPVEALNGLNNEGLAVGFGAADIHSPPRAFVDEAGVRAPLALPPGTISSGALGVNNTGQIVGWLANATGSSPFVWTAGVTVLLPSPLTSAQATHINAAGLIAGNDSSGVANSSVPVVWRAGQASVLTPFAPFANTVDLNDVGQVVLSEQYGTSSAITVYDANTDQYTPVSTGETWNYPGGINASGTLVGTAGERAFAWTASGGVRFLTQTVPSEATDINAAGHIAGSRDGVPGVWIGAAFIDVQQAVSGGWLIGRPYQINDRGEMLAYAFENGVGDLLIVRLTPRAETTRYCAAGTNSTGAPAPIEAEGSASVSLNVFALSAGPVPAGSSGLFLFGATQAQVPFGAGFLCVGQPFQRLPVESSSAGVLRHELDLNSAQAGLIQPGTTWNFQAWYRDPAAAPAFGTSDGLAVIFRP